MKSEAFGQPTANAQVVAGGYPDLRFRAVNLRGATEETPSLIQEKCRCFPFYRGWIPAILMLMNPAQELHDLLKEWNVVVSNSPSKIRSGDNEGGYALWAVQRRATKLLDEIERNLRVCRRDDPENADVADEYAELIPVWNRAIISFDNAWRVTSQPSEILSKDALRTLVLLRAYLAPVLPKPLTDPDALEFLASEIDDLSSTIYTLLEDADVSTRQYVNTLVDSIMDVIHTNGAIDTSALREKVDALTGALANFSASLKAENPDEYDEIKFSDLFKSLRKIGLVIRQGAHDAAAIATIAALAIPVLGS